MNNIQLYINDQPADLSDDSPIALTFQINNLADVQNQQGNTSNQFKLPLTQRNRQLLGFPDDIAFTSILPYRQYQAKIIQDGLEIIPYAVAELNSIEQDMANITILSGNVDFFDAIDGKIYDMGDSTSQWSNFGNSLVWKPYDHVWNLDNAVSSQTKTDGWIWPVVDYGFFDKTDFTIPIDVRNLRPGFFIKTAIDLLLQSAGYKGKGSLLADPLYPLLICQFSNSSFDHGTDYQNQPDDKGMSAVQNADVLIEHQNALNPGGNLKFNIVNSDKANQFSSQQYFTANSPNSIAITLSLPHVYLKGFVTPEENAGKFTVNIYYHINGTSSDTDAVLTSYEFSFSNFGENRGSGPDSDPKGWRRISGSGSSIFAEIDIFNIKLSFQTTIAQGDTLYMGYVFTGKTPISVINYAGSTLDIVSQEQKVQFGQSIQCERILPDISQKDLLKDTLQRFGIICQTDNASKTISFNSFRDIVNNIPIAKDWTSRCIDQGKQVSFRLGNYSQVNYMQYKADDNILPLKFGWSQINIDDQLLPASGTLFESQFGATLNQPYYGGTVAQIEMHDDTQEGTDLSIGVAPRILIDQKFDLRQIGKAVTFTDGVSTRIVNDVISIPYFYKTDAPQLTEEYGKGSLLFEDLRSKYYTELEKILTRSKKVIRYFLLNPRDILELDLLIPVYLQQDGAYYYINKIDSWRKGQPCKVELVKLG